MYAKPSEKIDDEDNGFSFHKEDIKYNRFSTDVKTFESIHTDQVAKDVQREVEFTVLNACMTGCLKSIDDYVNGHDINDFLHTGWTPLLYASASVLPDAIEYLLTLGADPNRHKDGYTPLMALCNSSKESSEKWIQCFRLLIKAKVNVNARNNRMETPLMLACMSRGLEEIKELLSYVQDIEARDHDERTAIFYAIIANKYEVVKFLLESNANITCKDRRGLSPKDIAYTKDFDKIIKLLDSEDNTQVICELTNDQNWKCIFPALCDKNEKATNFDVITLLYGMGFEKYRSHFHGMDLKTFLHLQEEDLIRLGMDIKIHRKQFLENLYKFHIKKWSIQSIGTIKKSLPFTIFDGIISLGKTAKQISVIGSSFRYIKNSLQRAKDVNLDLFVIKKSEYNTELTELQRTLKTLKKEVSQMKTIAEKIDKNAKCKIPATYIGKKKSYNWPVILSVTLIIGLYLTKTTYIRRLWIE
ncbi:ankyrin repeat, SAM and basic leucine zipper domain-containing protein 1 isoform X2 [Orussus abietinus]|uniref:ankyrin repeat, SAM and basic leucine zipper domain-containing protein 1 isoform X2 n=1 Tax=Orussus abietinus TaxID=222816 RepID=UPI000626EB67|nr:ankyrin repeat, SAM and basic leucine zipper domain-containing protein 1 isoform X2 [Orussus abietinus]